MKIGPYTLSATRTPKPEVSELGASGVTILQGIISGTEYNADLQGEKGRTVYDTMRRSDGQVKACLMVHELPLRAAQWSLTPASQDAQDIEICDALSANLFEGMSITWDSFLKHALISLPMGFMAFEKVWQIVDGQVKLKKLAPRLPTTILKWLPTSESDIPGIQQMVWVNSSFAMPEIPGEKVLLFVNEQEGDNYEGCSILRSAYKHWYYKDNLYRIAAIAAARHGLGVLVFTHPSQASDADKKRLDDIGRNLSAHEQMYVRLASDYALDIKGVSGTVVDALPLIDHHNRMIAMSVLADFLIVGGTSVGSFALSKDKSSLFLMALNAVANNITDTVNRHLIPQWVNYNYADVTAYPKLVVSGLETREMASYSQAVLNLVNAGMLTSDPAIRR